MTTTIKFISHPTYSIDITRYSNIKRFIFYKENFVFTFKKYIEIKRRSNYVSKNKINKNSNARPQAHPFRIWLC